MIRQLPFVAAVILASVLGTSAANAAPLGDGASVVGGGLTFGGRATFTVSAHSGLQGDFGYASVHDRPDGQPAQFWDMEVRCVNVVGNTAFVTGVIVRASEGSIPGVGDFMGVLLKDEGGPSEAPVDGFTLTFGVSDPNPETACHSIAGPFFSFTNVTAGDVRISG
jgi:hypothetical protein